MKYLLPIVAGILLVGCSGSDDGDVAAANKAAAEAPKSADELPAEMSPEARRSAEAAMKQSEAMRQQMDSQAAAMKKARENSR
ncbi:hypothetical protein MCEMSE15_02269 [Fimbriimonadaceae bacterium]|jgi:hypothetical protein